MILSKGFILKQKINFRNLERMLKELTRSYGISKGADMFLDYLKDKNIYKEWSEWREYDLSYWRF